MVDAVGYYRAITGKEDTGVNAGSQNYSRSETRTSTVEVKAEAQARKIRKTEVPADVEQLPEEIKIISEERIGDKHRARAAEWLQELQVNGYFLDSEEGEYDRRVNYINEARTAKQLAAVMDDLPPVPAARKYHGTMAPGADQPDLGKWWKDHHRVVIGCVSFPSSVAFTALCAMIFFGGHRSLGTWVAGVVLVLVGLVWFATTWLFCADPAEKK